MSGIHQMMLAVGLAKYTTSGTFTSTSGTYSGGFLYGKGYSTTLGFGSAMSPATLLDGKTIQTVFENQGGGPFYATTIEISGFSSDPGASYFSSITVNSITVNATSFTYSYSAGVAQWQVNGSTIGVGDIFNMPTSGSVSWTLTNYG